MLKATLRSAVLLGLLVWSVPSFAEVQNIKVGGDFTVRAFHRENLDLFNGDGDLDSDDNFLMSTTGLNVAADLTENVAAFVRLANERDWDVGGSATADFDVSQAYLKLREVFYSPVTVTIGAQPIVWGRGFILGSNLLGKIVLGGGDPNRSITADEYTDFTAFDAIRAQLDLSGVGGIGMPLALDYVYIKGDENDASAPDDVTIQGVNLGTKLADYNSEIETYFLNKRDESAASGEEGSVNTLGFRGSGSPVGNTFLYGELAYQWGVRGPDLESELAAGSSVSSWAANLGAEYTLADVATTPTLGAEWRFYEGSKHNEAAIGWDPIAPGYFRTAIREFMTRDTLAAFFTNNQANVTSGQTNQHELGLYGSASPLEDLKVLSRVSFFILDVGALSPVVNPPAGFAGARQGQKRRRWLGTEWDTMFTYDYTEDVQLSLLHAIFWPGSVFVDAHDGLGGQHTAQQLVTTVSVKF